MSNKAQSRYETQLETRKLPDGRTVYAPVIPRIVVSDVQDVSIIADEQNRADIIAKNAYGNASEWWRIASANGNFKGSLHFTPGQKIVIPRK